MPSQLALPKGYFRSEEFPEIFSSLMNHLLESRASIYPGIFSPMSEYVHYTRFPYKPSDVVQNKIRNIIDEKLLQAIRMQQSDEVGKHMPWEINDLCIWGIIAHQLGIDYDLTIKDPNDEDILKKETPRDISRILNFEFYHYEYENNLKHLGIELPLDILYFAKVNNLLSSLRTRLISELDGRCKIPIRRIATYDELRQRRNCLAEELRETGEDSSSDYTVRWLDRILNPHNQNTKESKIRLQLSIHWTAEDGTILCFPDLIDSVIPRQPHEHDQITCWLGAGIEKALKDYCQTSSPNQKVISVVYKRNRVKDFIGTDIALPQKYALHDDLDFSTFNPDKLADWIDQMVDKFGPHDLGSELALPTTLTPQQYRAYRIVKKVAEYIFRGPLTYDTPIKKQMLVRTQGLHAPPSYLMLPCLKK